MRNRDSALDGRFALITGQMSVDAVVAAALEAEEAGAETVLVGEDAKEPDAFVTAAAVLAATRRVRAGPGVVSVWDRHPLTLARAAATLDRIAPGRALLGIGRGDPSLADHGIASGGRGLIVLEDTLQIVRPALAGAAVDYTGKHWSARLPSLPARTRAREVVPLYLAAVGPRALQLAGGLADGVLLNYGASPAYVRWALHQVEQGARSAGRDPQTVDVLGLVLIARTDIAGARDQVERVRAVVAAILRLPGQGATLAAPTGGVPERLDDESLAMFAAIGDDAQVRGRLDDYRRAGLRCPVLLPSGLRAMLGKPAGQHAS